VHLLSSRLGPINSTLLDDAVQAMIGRVNRIECTAEGNLMSPGCDSGDRIRLSAGQIDHARAQAQTGGPASF
jgi:hypothetical protein